MSKKLNIKKDGQLIHNLVKENFKKVVGIEIDNAVITKELRPAYKEYVDRMANFFFNYTKMSRIESLKVMKDVEKSFEIEVQ